LVCLSFLGGNRTGKKIVHRRQWGALYRREIQLLRVELGRGGGKVLYSYKKKREAKAPERTTYVLRVSLGQRPALDRSKSKKTTK